MVYMAMQLNCKQLYFFTSNFRRNSSLDLLKKTTGTFRKYQTKQALRMDTPHYNANAGLPKLSNQYGNGVLIVAASTRSFCSYTGKVTFTECEAKQEFENKKLNLCKNKGFSNCFKQGKIKNLYKKLLNKDFLSEAYWALSKSKGMNVAGPDTKTFDGFSEKNLEKLIFMLKDHSFKFKSVKKIAIPKKQKGVRLIGIPSVNDKVVLKAMSILLNDVFEPKFNRNSHGFRPNKSCHTALKNIQQWNGTKWFIEADIVDFFNEINHELLIGLIKKQIDDIEFIDLIQKALKMGYFNNLTNVSYAQKGIIQGSNLSPILSNIYLHELDVFLENLIMQSKESGATSIVNPEYKKLHTKISNMRQVFSPNYRWKTKLTKKILAERLLEVKSLEKKRAALSSTIKGSGYRIYYIRYADDFLIGVNGTRTRTVAIKKLLNNFLSSELNLELSVGKTKITSAVKNRAKFLGAAIRATTSRTNDTKRRPNSYTKHNRKVKARFPHGQINLFVPLEDVVKKLANQGMCNILDFRTRKIIPKRKTSWINLPLEDIVRKYDYVWTGILNYYSFAYNRSQLNLIQYIIQHSAACTIMNKQNLSSRAKVFKKYGKSLIMLNDTNKVQLSIKSNLKRLNKFNIKAKLPYDVFNYSLRSKIAWDFSCVICGTKTGIEMHHRRPLKQKNTDNSLKGIKGNMGRKQIPLCKKCHFKVHSGQYNGPGIY